MLKTMRKLFLLSMLLLPLITDGCATTSQQELILPPKPEREEVKPCESVQDMAELLNYYEHLVQKWEVWGLTVEYITKNKSPSRSGN